MAEHAAPGPTWQVWVDTGGTFTDCLAIDPTGRWRRAKVLSSSALRGRFAEAVGARELRYEASWRLPDAFADGADLHWLKREDSGVGVVASRGAARRIEVDRPLPADLAAGEPFEIRFVEQAPVLAARLVTGTPAGQPLPPVAVRLATTRGTNALLERRGARCLLCVTRGFADLLRIGDQRRADLFALDVRRPKPLYAAVIEVPERLAADGEVIEALELGALRKRLREVATKVETAAVAMLHSYQNPAHERIVRAELERAGITFVSASAELAPVVGIQARAETAVVDAYLAPVVQGYLRDVESAVGGRMHAMTSAGGLAGSEGYRAKDSLLSGPAGGVVGAARSGRDCGMSQLIAFDMGGTSTDVSRFDGDFEYVFEHAVGGARVAAPALAIETVAAGGGSICHREGRQLKVGPKSAGAVPGPACYGAGGPLTLTDVNLLLGRLDPRRFGIPIQSEASAAAAEALLADLEAASGESPREALLAGLLRIADERMADAVRRISVRRGYDPRSYALVAFGGAGGQHACRVAELLGMKTIVAPREAGLLSALGLGTAVIERFVFEQLTAPLARVVRELEERLAELARRAVAEVVAEGVERSQVVVRRRLAFLRLEGQDATLEIEVDAAGDAGGRPLEEVFEDRYEGLYGYPPPARPIEIDSLKVVASQRLPELAARTRRAAPRGVSSDDLRRAFVGGGWRRVPVFQSPDLRPGDCFSGPALVLDDFATLLVGGGWRARTETGGDLILEAGAGS